MVSALIIGILSSIVIIREITTPLKKVVEVFEKISAGDLSAKDLDVNGTDELGVLTLSLNKMKDKLNRILSQINGLSKHIASAIRPTRSQRPWRR